MTVTPAQDSAALAAGRRQVGSSGGEGRRRPGDVALPDHYVWLVLVAAMDVMLTWLILQLGGREVNWVADQVLQQGGLPGLLVLKFVVISFVICVCEYIARTRLSVAQRLVGWAIALHGVPLGVAVIQLYAFAGAY